MSASIEVKGLDELIARMNAFPDKLKDAVQIAISSSLLALWGSVPPYPAPPEGSTYRRTGTLGRTLGSSEGGGQSGDHPTIYQVKSLGSGNYEGHFGTNLEYAPYVIGDNTQAWMHKGRWWVMADVARAAGDKITQVFSTLAEQLRIFLEGNG